MRRSNVMARREYIPKQYWKEIYRLGYDESAVGYPNLARSLNQARYNVERQNVSQALETAGVSRPRRVLDVGSGSGIWIDFWARHGVAEIVGVDIAEAAVRRLRDRYPEHRFLVVDVGDPDASLPTEMDVVSAMSVLLHIVDDERFAHALRNLLASVASSGSLVLVEPIIVHRWWGPSFDEQANSKARPLTDYMHVLREEGFTLVDMRPTSCLLVNVIDTRYELSFRILERYWEWMSRAVGRRERVGRAVGSVLAPVDLLATRIVFPGPSAKIVVARRESP